jgi:hypothetical protein
MSLNILFGHVLIQLDMTLNPLEGVVTAICRFLIAAICRLKFSLITYAIGDLLAYVLHLQVLCRLLVMCYWPSWS